MADNEKEKNTSVTGLQVDLPKDYATICGGTHFYRREMNKGALGDSEKIETCMEHIAFDPANAINILHISDLHFGADKKSEPLSDANRWCGQLIDDLRDELDCDRLHAVIISGDIGNFSNLEEYQAAEIFLECLGKQFELNPSDLIVVPGNHDLNWKISKKGYRLIDEDDLGEPLKDGHYVRISDDVIRLRDDDKYPERFRNFSRFYEKATGFAYPSTPKRQATFHHFPELNLLFVGFNSSWEIDHHFPDRVSINPDTVEFALSRIRERPDFKACVKFAVWHHPLYSPGEDRIKDYGVVHRLAQAEFDFSLHGHIHKADANVFRFDLGVEDRRINIIGAGTFGAPVREWTSGYPLQYNLLRLSSNILRVETRRRIEPNGTWESDHLWRQGKGKPLLPYYDLAYSGGAASAPKSENMPLKLTDGILTGNADPVSEAEVRAYLSKAESIHENLPLVGFATHLKVPIDLEDIYIPLRAMVNLKGIDDFKCYGDSNDAEEHLLGCDAAIEIPLLDAFKEAERRKRKGLVILGDPGSGKTTHMKRLLLWCLRNGSETIRLPKDMIPVFLPLREMVRLEKGLDRFIQDQLASRHLKMNPDFGKRLLERGNLLFLMDGLDEVVDLGQRREVSLWIEEAFTDYPDCRFVITCRFSGYRPSIQFSEKFLEIHVRPLSEKYAEKFIRKWYDIVEKGLAQDTEQAESIARKKADHLIKRLKQPDFRARRLFEMTRNPLLLTNICIVHRYRGSLPQRRSILYEECIDVLLEHWRESKKIKLRVNALEGRKVLQPAALWLHQEEGRIRASTDDLAPIIEPALREIRWQGGDARDFLRIIRDESGLLTGWDQKHFGFMHLGFQEYLAALEIRSRFLREMNEHGKSELLKYLAGNFGESWWQEVTLLLLALEDQPMFVPFMREVVRHPAFAQNAELMEMCIDDAVKTSAEPFIELLKSGPGEDRNFWDHQLLALRMVKRIDENAMESIMDRLKRHPYDPIRQWINERLEQISQDVIRPEPSRYELVWIKGGTFMMGSNEKGWEEPIHEVTVPGFYMGRYPVTNEEYGRFIQATRHPVPRFWAERSYNQPRQPVVGVSWHDVRAFAKWAGLDLPSEAQWEYACRADTSTRYFTGNSDSDLERAGWCGRNSGSKLHPVGKKKPNAFGLYDMHGNVWEWCEDHWHVNYEGAPADGSSWVDLREDAVRVSRGGSWDFVAENCRAASRSWYFPENRFFKVGFRLVLLPGR